MGIPEDRIQQAQAVPILEVWLRLGLPDVPEGKPFCSPFREDRKPSCQLGGRENIFFDHATKESLDTIALVRKVRSCGFSEAVQFLIGSGSGNVPPAPPTSRAAAAKPKAGEKKIWQTLDEADTAFEKLLPASENPAALQMYAGEYGLPEHVVPNWFRVFDYPKLGLGVVMPGILPTGETDCYKYKSFARDSKGKRSSRYVYGGGGALALASERPDAPVVIVCGEEKALAAYLVGYGALCLLAGEKPLGAEWAAKLSQNPDRVFILANDHDEIGRKANSGTAAALEQAGMDPALIHVVQWPADAPTGYDLNDVLKTKGIDGLREFLDAAPVIPTDTKAPRASALGDFLSAPRPELRYWIPGVLPDQGKVTLSAAAKAGKTMLGIQLGFCLASGGAIKHLGMEFGGPARVLYVQPELSDGLMAARCGWILKTAPDFIQQDSVLQNFIVYETANGRPDCATEPGKARLQAVIEKTRPNILIADPLYMLFKGLAENDADQMSLALDFLAGLALRYDLGVVLIHHFNKGGTAARGSSVFQGWAESDFTLSAVDGDPEVVRVDGLFRCSWGEGFPAFWQKPRRESPWFERIDGYEPQGKGRPRKARAASVVTVLKAEGQPLGYSSLVDKMVDLMSCGGRTAERLVKEAKDGGLVRLVNGCYLPID